MSYQKEVFCNNSIKPISINSMETILYQMKNCTCEIHKGEKRGSGFFAKIPYRNELINVLITNEHVLGIDDIIEGKNITISLFNGKNFKNIQIDSKRKRYLNQNLDITIIEIRQDQDKIYDFLSLDKQIFNFKYNEKINNYIDIYKGQSIYLLNYINGNEIFASLGLLKDINNNEIIHKCNTDKGSSGSPIILLSNNKVIGVHHSGTYYNDKSNFGTLLSKPISEFQNISNNLLVIKKDNNQIGKINNIKINMIENSLINTNMNLNNSYNLNNSKFQNNLNIRANLDENLNLSISIIKERQKLLNEIHIPLGNKNDPKKEYYLINKNYLKEISGRLYLENILSLIQQNPSKNDAELLSIAKTNLNEKIKKDLNNLNKEDIQKILKSKDKFILNHYFVNKF